MAEVLVLADHVDGRLTGPATELLTIARRLGPAAAVCCGRGAERAAEEAGRFGAARVYLADAPEIDEYLVAPKVAVLAELTAAGATAAVLLTSTPEGKEIAGRLAVRIGAGVLTDAVDVRPGSGGPLVTQSVFAGSYQVTSTVTRGAPVIAVKPNAVSPEPAGATPVVEKVPGRPVSARAAARVIARTPHARTGRPDLGAARVVVAGGRGLGAAEHFALVERLADTLGAAVGASRAAVDAGWYPHAAQVGQTGTTVSPDLYIAVGISGAIQHWAGMRTARTIVAVNTDRDAPIMRQADFAVVGDLFDVLPQVTEEIRSRKR